jgi:hypothetical protein
MPHGSFPEIDVRRLCNANKLKVCSNQDNSSYSSNMQKGYNPIVLPEARLRIPSNNDVAKISIVKSRSAPVYGSTEQTEVRYIYYKLMAVSS